MSVPRAIVVCQFAIAVAIGVLAAVLYAELPRYQFLQGAAGLIRADVRTGAAVSCVEVQVGEAVRCE